MVAHEPDGDQIYCFDNIIVANGELWRSKLVEHTGSAPLTAKDYQTPDPFANLKVLVVGGGVSGADISAELSQTAAQVHWSIRKPALLLPRMWGQVPNDGCFSYIGRHEVQSWGRERYLRFLYDCMPEYMNLYGSTGLLPDSFHNNAIHVNDTAIAAVASGRVQVRSGVTRLSQTSHAEFVDGSTETYDRIILCAGYQPPDYSFIDGFSPQHLYEHFFNFKDPTLAILNAPATADGYGTACPYFEAIAFWILQVFDGACTLPSYSEMQSWCEARVDPYFHKRFYDCWLETIRIGVLSRQLPNPAEDFQSYWHIVSNGVTPSNLRSDPRRSWVPAYDHLVDIAGRRARILAALPASSLARLVAKNHITMREAEHAETMREEAISPSLC
jgi:hypothetical protein